MMEMQNNYVIIFYLDSGKILSESTTDKELADKLLEDFIKRNKDDLYGDCSDITYFKCSNTVVSAENVVAIKIDTALQPI